MTDQSAGAICGFAWLQSCQPIWLLGAQTSTLFTVAAGLGLPLPSAQHEEHEQPAHPMACAFSGLQTLYQPTISQYLAPFRHSLGTAVSLRTTFLVLGLTQASASEAKIDQQIRDALAQCQQPFHVLHGRQHQGLIQTAQRMVQRQQHQRMTTLATTPEPLQPPHHHPDHQESYGMRQVCDACSDPQCERQLFKRWRPPREQPAAPAAFTHQAKRTAIAK